MLTTQYETFIMKEGESIKEMHTRFTAVKSELHYLDEDIRPFKHVWKILSIPPKSLNNKVDSMEQVMENIKSLWD